MKTRRRVGKPKRRHMTRREGKHKTRKHMNRKHMTRKHKTRKHKTRKHKTRKHKTRKHMTRNHKNRKPKQRHMTRKSMRRIHHHMEPASRRSAKGGGGNITDFDENKLNTYFETEKRKIELAIIRDATEFKPIDNFTYFDPDHRSNKTTSNEELMKTLYTLYEKYKDDLPQIELVFDKMSEVYETVKKLLEDEIKVLASLSKPLPTDEPPLPTVEPPLPTVEPLTTVHNMVETAYIKMTETYKAARDKKQIHNDSINTYDCSNNLSDQLFQQILDVRKGIIDQLNSQLSNVYIALFKILENKAIKNNIYPYEPNEYKLEFNYREKLYKSKLPDVVVDVLTDFIQIIHQNLSYKLNPAIYADIMKILDKPIDFFFKNLKVVKKFWDGKTPICNDTTIKYLKGYIIIKKKWWQIDDKSYSIDYVEIDNKYNIFYNSMYNESNNTTKLTYEYFIRWFITKKYIDEKIKIQKIYDENIKENHDADQERADKNTALTKLEMFLNENEKKLLTQNTDFSNDLNNTGVFIIDVNKNIIENIPYNFFDKII